MFLNYLTGGFGIYLESGLLFFVTTIIFFAAFTSFFGLEMTFLATLLGYSRGLTSIFLTGFLSWCRDGAGLRFLDTFATVFSERELLCCLGASLERTVSFSYLRAIV